MKNLFRKIIKYVTHPRKIIIWLNEHGFARLFSDKFYLKCAYKDALGKKLNLKNPQTFNEKLQWLKLYDRGNDSLPATVDKYAVKQIVADKIGEQYVIKAYGIWDSFEEIEFDKLPNKFVLKTTHDCGGVVICKDKKTFDYEKAKSFLEMHLQRRYFYHAREWPYKNAKPRILAEEFVGKEDECLVVYKVFCFGGEPRIIQVIQGDKSKDETIDYFDENWNLLSLRQNFPNSVNHLPKPDCLQEMLELSNKLSSHRPFLRVDWYIIDGKLKFSEFTYYSDAGFAQFEPEEWDYKLGEWIELPLKK